MTKLTNLLLATALISSNVNAFPKNQIEREIDFSKSSIAKIVDEISVLKENCDIDKSGEEGGIFVEEFSCNNGKKGKIRTIYKEYSKQITYRGENYSCSDVSSNITISHKGKFEYIEGQGSVLKGEDKQLLMSNKCNDISQIK